MTTLTVCCVCNKNSSGMIQIANHPNKLDTLLNFISGHHATEVDFLCIVCYEELKQACDFKTKCIESKLYRPEKAQNEADVKTEPEEPKDKITDCDSSIISMSEFLGSNGYVHVLPNDEEDVEEAEQEIEEIVIEDSSEDESTQPEKTSSPRKSKSPSKTKKTKTDEDVELFFSTSDKLCEYCFKTFETKHGAEIHKKTHKFETHPYICPYKNCKKNFQKRQYLQSHFIAHLTNYKCSFCDKTYKSKILMENHEKSHEPTSNIDATSESSTSSSSKKSSKKYECKVCSRVFGAKANLVFHVKYQHDKNWSSKQFECILCDDVFTQSEKLAAHLKKVHKCS